MFIAAHLGPTLRLQLASYSIHATVSNDEPVANYFFFSIVLAGNNGRPAAVRGDHENELTTPGPTTLPHIRKQEWISPD